MFHCSENFRFDYPPVTVIQSVVTFPRHSPWYRPGRFAPNPVRPLSRFARIPVRPGSFRPHLI